ncbi:MAG: hypothetical protein M1831_001898 [Alyxoria varia]|nr:MAG: hypothetical protein M1831_001898 [Alyxoria varia]
MISQNPPPANPSNATAQDTAIGIYREFVRAHDTSFAVTIPAPNESGHSRTFSARETTDGNCFLEGRGKLMSLHNKLDFLKPSGQPVFTSIFHPFGTTHELVPAGEPSRSPIATIERHKAQPKSWSSELHILGNDLNGVTSPAVLAAKGSLLNKEFNVTVGDREIAHAKREKRGADQSRWSTRRTWTVDVKAGVDMSLILALVLAFEDFVASQQQPPPAVAGAAAAGAF